MKLPFNLTAEQHLIVHSSVDVLLVQAFAGTGKTSTLAAMARANPHLKILYLAFGKAVQAAAARHFPPNVTSKTNHALAWDRFGAAYKAAGKLGFVSARDLMSLYALVPREARHVLAALERFIRSADPAVGDLHVAPDLLDKAHRARVRDFAAEAWSIMVDKQDDRLKITHDGYFKLFQLSKPDLSLEYDLILGDEWQDTNPVTHALVTAQACRLIFVGDTHQSIYAFRGATNAMRQVEADFSESKRSFEVLRLTHSFRFGKGIADLATSLLASVKGEKHPLVGCGAHESVWRLDRTRPYAIIGRSNGTLFGEAVALLGRSTFHLIGLEENPSTGEWTYGPFEKLVDVHYLLTGRNELVKDTFVKAFKSGGQLEHYAGEVDDKELLMLMKISKDYGGKVPALVARIKAEVARDPAKAHVTLSTAHRAKGLEFEQVVLTGDFEEFIANDGKLKRATTPELVQELNLLYVAATRALIALEANMQIKAVLAALKRESFVLPKEKSAVAVIARAQTSAAADVPQAASATPAPHPPAESAAVAPASIAQAAVQPSVQLARGELKIPRDFHKRALKDQVAHAILVEGLLDLNELSILLARTREDTIRVLANLIGAGHLAARLFSHESDVSAAAGRCKDFVSRTAITSDVFL